MSNTTSQLEQQFAGLNEHQLRRLLVEHLTKRKLGLNWEHNDIERDNALNNDIVLPQLNEELSSPSQASTPYRNLIIEGDNFDALRLLRATHANKIRVIYIDPPYNTGNKDWVYNDHYVQKTDRWRFSQWLEFLYQRLTLARDLLTPDGVIMVSINDENRAKLELLMDEVFPRMRAGSFVWKCRSGGNDTKGTLLSSNHEHVLVYANEGFSFAGDGREESSYANPDEDPRGDWANDNLVKAHTARQRPEAYYSIRNPETDTWYLCDPDSVWRFASLSRPQKKKLQADPIETIIEEKRILWPGNDKTVVYSTLTELQQAINDGTAPRQLKIYTQLKELKKLAAKDDKIVRLLSYIEPLENWVGRTIGYGKPRYKRFRQTLLRDVTPLSSWLNPAAEKKTAEDDEDDEGVTLTVGATSEGTTLVKEITGNKDFPYPKPLSLVRGLIQQAAKPGDIVLDFFAGSGTTAQAVLELQEELPGLRFIMCSSTEATKTEPDKNVCRNICAERVRRVIEGYGDRPGLGGDFAYIELSKLPVADARLDVTDDQAFQLLSLRETHCATPLQSGPAWTVAANSDLAVVYLPSVTKTAISALTKLPQARLAVYSARPQTVAQHLETSGKSGESYAIGDVILPIPTDELV
ncbi:site-specific DNA-methyltransferase [Massilia sp.]|uniref:site-specific DNA-methyltransferase n=1 Tax=Massilia sp. TaxID=1882437 RepID=UPI0028A5A019|nr:site-specific DNA-methyltransferase [Massilia sp.]